MTANHGYEQDSNRNDLFIPLNQYATDVGTNDYVERAYIFGSGAAELQQATFVIAADGTRTIENIVVQPQNDGFDYETVDDAAQIINETILKPTLDPFGLSQEEVSIQWTQAGILSLPTASGETTTYTLDRYQTDKIT